MTERPDRAQADPESDAPDENGSGSANLPARRRAGGRSETPDDRTSLLRYGDIPGELAEALRTIVNRSELREGTPLPKVVAVTSALLGEGVTTASQALATLIAQEMGRFVCWVDCSWLSATGDEPEDGRTSLVDLLADNSLIYSAFDSSADLPQLVSLSPGAVPRSKRNMIVRSPEFEYLLTVLTEEFDHLILDVPPVLSNANSLALLRRADATLIVVRHRATSIAQIERAIEAIQPTPNLGVVLNRYRSSIPLRLRRLLGE